MATHSHDGLIYEALGIEFQEFSRSGFSHGTSLDISRAPSERSGLTEDDRVHDDDRSLIAHQEVSAPEFILNKASKHCEAPSQLLRKRRYRFKSWKVGVTTAAVTTTTVFLVNSLLTVWASIKFGTEDGIGTAYEGACGTVSAWSFWLHILINGLSSMLLSASNYTMQCVTAPTRRECDLAHVRGDWLDIGVPSIRNLFRISWQRRITWILLAFSNTPIHLLYNSAVFKTLDDNSYLALLAGPKFLDEDYALPTEEILSNVSKGTEELIWKGVDRPNIKTLAVLHKSYVADPLSFNNISSTSCIETYGTYYLSGHGDLILVASDDVMGNSLGFPQMLVPFIPFNGTIYEVNSPFNWMCAIGNRYCNSPADLRKLSAQRNWSVNGAKVDYCLSQVQPQRCKLQFSLYVLLAVIICNIIKCTTMYWVVFQQNDSTLVTFGDAISSWLGKPDQATANYCFHNVHSIVLGGHPRTPQSINLATRRWRLGASRRRWFTTISILAIALCVVCACLAMTNIQMRQYTADTIDSIGFGAVNSNMLLDIGLSRTGTSGLASSVLFANLPQIILSFIYLSYNALITCMLLAKEYSGYEVHRKTLRVTTPCGQQRSTYWLQLPYAYGIPVMTTSATLHWLISQSLFLVRVNTYNHGTLDKDLDVSGVGLSPAPMLVVLILGLSLVAIAIGMGFRKLEGNAMPVAASCSLVLAAAAHRPPGDVNAAFLPVKWGEVVEMGNADVGHCCFTSQEVMGMKPGRKYAGTVKQD